jgi:uncharacterized protein YicC (UPF0701 family)
MVEELNVERRAQIRAIISNGAYLQSKEGLQARKQEIEALNEEFDKLIDKILDPFKEKREQEELMANPLFAAGIRGFEKLKWDIRSGALIIPPAAPGDPGVVAAPTAEGAMAA